MFQICLATLLTLTTVSGFDPLPPAVLRSAGHSEVEKFELEQCSVFDLIGLPKDEVAPKDALAVAAFLKRHAFRQLPNVTNGDLLGDSRVIISKLEKDEVVEGCVAKGNDCLVRFFIALHALSIFAHEESRSDEERVRYLRRAVRYLEVLQPRLPTELLPCLLARYKSSAASLRRLVFSRTQLGEHQPRSQHAAGRVNLVMTVVGAEFSQGARATIRSLLFHTSASVHLYVLSDLATRTTFMEAVADLDVATTWIDLSVHKRYIQIYRSFPKTCVEDVEFGGKSRVRSLLDDPVLTIVVARIFLHEILPSIERVISVDAGDLVFLSDVERLWSYFDWFHPRQFFGAAWEAGAGHVQVDNPGARSLWAAKGLPRLAKGINGAILMFDLARMRNSAVNGSRWTNAMLASAHFSSLFSCRIGGLREQEILNTFIFRGGDRHMYELSSKWNYIPDLPWELAEQDARATGLVAEVLKQKIHPGLVNAGRFVHYCPKYVDLVGDWVVADDDAERRQWWAGRAKEYHLWFTVFGAAGFYTDDTRCGESVWVLHLAGFTKFVPWGRQLIEFWQSPPIFSAAAKHEP